MNRNQEFDILKKELDATPPELEFTVARAKARAKSHRRRWVALPAGIAAVFAAFVILANTSTSFAYALADVPILGDLAAALETSGFMEDLRSAVTNQHAQVIGQKQTVDGLSVTVEYAVTDPWQVNLFVRTDSEDPNYPYTGLELLAPDGIEVFVFDEDENGWLRRCVLTFPDGNLPQELILQFLAWPEAQADGNRPENPTIFDFTVTIEEAAVSPVKTLEIGQWVIAGDQQIWLDRLEITHAQTWLVMDGAAENSGWLSALKASLFDDSGEYSGPVFTRGTDESGEHIISLGGSVWHTASDQLQLQIKNTWWNPKSAVDVSIDTVSKTAIGLPEWLTLEDIYVDENYSTHYYPGRPEYQITATILCFSCPADRLADSPYKSPFTFQNGYMINYTQVGSTAYFEVPYAFDDTVISLKLGSGFACEDTLPSQISIPIK